MSRTGIACDLRWKVDTVIPETLAAKEVTLKEQ